MEQETTNSFILDAIEKIALEVGFESIGRVHTNTLHVHPEVRDMCAANRCNRYGRSWSCPPACNPIEVYQERIQQSTTGIIVQTVGQMEDSFDFETIEESSARHNKRFREFVEKVRALGTDACPSCAPYFLGAGTCSICSTCTYPDAPCRFPDKCYVSLEAAGFVVNEVCVAAGLPYNHGANTISFTGGVFV